MAKLLDIASYIQDLYKQNYGANDDFFEEKDFVWWTASTYSSMLNTMYQAERMRNKQVDGFSNIEIPAAWLIEEEIKLETDPKKSDQCIATLKQPVFSFDWDNAANGLMGVHSIGQKHCIYRKISLNERRFRQVIPPSSATFFYLNSPKNIIFWDGKEGAEVSVQYVPAVVGQDEDCLLSDNIIPALSDSVLERMFKAKNGNFIQKLDDQNQNIAQQQQINPRGPGNKM